MQDRNNFQFFVNKVSKTFWMIIISIMMLLIVGATLLVYLTKDNFISIGHHNKINITPTQIQSIEQIGEWEFLSVHDEEIVDTLRTGFFGDDELVRIYYGTLRLGVDMKELGKDWLRQEGDSLIATLPAIKLLDEQFIDEARTRSFFESGTWNDQAREALYTRAVRQMRERCLNEGNMEIAKQNARLQFRNLLRSMGFNNVAIRFKGENKQ
ncbi:MAG: DUF4230 domain-containing protein [Prevotella sp.]|nr:DUF4230 domain-containing protein [Prevotella sp.]